MHQSESEVAQLCPTLSNPMDCSLPGSSIHGIFLAGVLEWGAIAFSEERARKLFFLTRKETERTYCFTTVGDQTCSLLESLLKVVCKSFIFIFFWPELKKFTYKEGKWSGEGFVLFFCFWQGAGGRAGKILRMNKEEKSELTYHAPNLQSLGLK